MLPVRTARPASFGTDVSREHVGDPGLAVYRQDWMLGRVQRPACVLGAFGNGTPCSLKPGTVSCHFRGNGTRMGLLLIL